MHFQVAYEQLCLVERGCDGCHSYSEFTRHGGNVFVHLRAEDDGRHVFPQLSSSHVTVSR